ncbi:hypothetical protein [Sphingomonas azotifigens]|uniref:hypothetical protein n=1 Tax=Sphingomonas azotifigens TaxID=330920 RepID=UPI000A032CFE|nr:hypothetical protein [Sphingomonas azotifigens]
MVSISASVDIDEFLDEIGASRSDLPSDVRAKISAIMAVDLDVDAHQDEIDENAREQEPEFLDLDAETLREAVKAILDGDLIIAGILFARALSEDANAATAVDQEIRRAISYRRSPLQLAVAA